MKKIWLIIAILISFTCIATCEQVGVSVLDAETGNPVSGAEVSFSFKGGNPFTPKYGSKVKVTDLTGNADCIIPLNVHFQGVNVLKEGYYRGLTSKKTQGKMNREVLLRIVLNPIKSSLVNIDRFLPELDVAVEFDMVKNDWLPPHGKGTHADIVFKSKVDFKDYKNYKADLKIEFLGKFNGVVFLDGSHLYRSGFRYPYLAPENEYEQVIDKSRIVTPKTHGSLTSDLTAEERKGDVYFIRIRSTEENGEFKDAIHGVISFIQFKALHGHARLKLNALINAEDRTRNIEMTKK